MAARRGASALAGLLAAVSIAAAQDSMAPAVAAAPPPAIGRAVGPGVVPAVVPSGTPAESLPFGPGEHLSYDVTLGGLGVGQASIRIAGWDSVAGHRVLHSLFVVKGGIPFFHVDDLLESWFDPHTMIAYKFIQRIHEGDYHTVRSYVFYPERAMYSKNNGAELPSVSNPLDDVSAFYFVRTVPLEVGKRYEFSRYFIPEKNPVTLKVLRRDTITVKAGRFATVVMQPMNKSGGVSPNLGETLLWLTDDRRHMLVQMKVKTKIPLLNSLNLYLRSIAPADSPVTDSATATP